MRDRGCGGTGSVLSLNNPKSPHVTVRELNDTEIPGKVGIMLNNVLQCRVRPVDVNACVVKGSVDDATIDAGNRY